MLSQNFIDVKGNPFEVFCMPQTFGISHSEAGHVFIVKDGIQSDRILTDGMTIEVGSEVSQQIEKLCNDYFAENMTYLISQWTDCTTLAIFEPNGENLIMTDHFPSIQKFIKLLSRKGEVERKGKISQAVYEQFSDMVQYNSI